jgi:hypothetical protein
MLNSVIELDDEDLELFASSQEWKDSELPANSASDREMYGNNVGVTAKMNQQTEDLYRAVMSLGNEYRRRFDNMPKSLDEEDIPAKEKIAKSSNYRGYCEGLRDALLLMANLNIPVKVPAESELPAVFKERKPDASIQGVIPTVEEQEKIKASENEDYEGDYVMAKGRKWFESDILDLISDASVVNESLTRQGQKRDNKIGRARALFPGMTDDDILAIPYKDLDKERRDARSHIRDNRNNKKAAAAKAVDIKNSAGGQHD